MDDLTITIVELIMNPVIILCSPSPLHFSLFMVGAFLCEIRMRFVAVE